MSVQKKQFFYPSMDGKTQIHAIEWAPDGAPAAVLQIAHGMVEFIDRYDRFARFLAENGVAVVGNDHLGHGESVNSRDDLGFFAVANMNPKQLSTYGNSCVIGDMYTLQQRTMEKFPGVPYFFLGHSMGSFLARQYIQLHADELRGAIIMGTGQQSPATLKAAKAICRVIARSKGERFRSPLLTNMALGSNNKKFEPARTANDWLTKDEKIVDAYNANPLNNFKFTVNAFFNMFSGIEICSDPANIAKIPKTFPILIVSGADDPVGGFGKGVKQVADAYKKAGLTDVQMKLYEGDRHEILNELDHDVVDDDILSWLNQKMP